MKRIIILLLAALLFAACQPTPAEDFVVNKAERTLEDIIAATPEPEAETVVIVPPPEAAVPVLQTTAPAVQSEVVSPQQADVSPATLQPQQTEPSAPESMRMTEVRWTDSFSVAAAMDRLDVEIDAEVSVPESGTAPVYRIGFAPPDPDDAARLIGAFFGDRQAYAASHEKTKSYYKAQMERYLAEQEKQTDAFNREQYDILLDQANKAYASAPDDAPLVPWDGNVNGGFDLMAENGDGTFRYGRANERSVFYLNAPEEPNVVPGLVMKTAPETDAERTAVETAEAFLMKLGVDAELSSLNGTDSVVRAFGSYVFEGYMVCFAPKYGGLPATDTKTFHGFDGAEEAAGGDVEPAYTIRYEPESIEFLISGDGEIVRFRHMRPSRILKTENTGAKLLPFSEVQDLFKKYIGKTTFVHKGEPLKLSVHTVRLTMQRYPVKDSSTAFYLLPAWEFVASVTSGTSLDAMLGSVCVLRINALDGSIMQ